MAFEDRQKLYRKIERQRNTKVIAYVTSDRQNMETRIAQDCVDLFVNLLDPVGPTKKISLLLHTNGGDTLAAWRLVNLLRTFSDEFEVLIPSRALSAGTLISIGSDRLVMTKQAALGPIDPSVNNPLNPKVRLGSVEKAVPVSVENVRGYLDAAREELGITDQGALCSVLIDLSRQIHPLVLGEIFRSRAQIRFLAEKLLAQQVKDQKKMKSIIDFLCADSGSHDYTINRREAAELGLNIEKPSDDFYKLLRKIQVDYSEELQLLEPYNAQAVLGAAPPNTPVAYSMRRGLVEGTAGGCFAFLSEGSLSRVTVPTPNGPQEGVTDVRQFEGWRKVA